jgi:hypothetical protein
MNLLPTHRTFLIVNQGIVSTVFNFFLNMGIAWFLYRAMDQVPLWGPLSIGMDTLATAFVLPTLTCYFIAVSLWFTIKKGWIPVIDDYPRTGMVGWAIRLPVILQGILYGLAGVLLLGVPVTAGFMLTGSETVSYPFFLWYKATFAAVLSLAVSPIIGLIALFGSRPRKKNR